MSPKMFWAGGALYYNSRPRQGRKLRSQVLLIVLVLGLLLVVLDLW